MFFFAASGDWRETRSACSSSIDKSASLWQMSSCSSLAIRLRSFSCAAINLTTHLLQGLLRKFLVGDIDRRTDKSGKGSIPFSLGDATSNIQRYTPSPRRRRYSLENGWRAFKACATVSNTFFRSSGWM
jgi:hypothetical protein